MVSQLHSLLLELLPGGAKKDLPAAQARVQLATVRPRNAAGKTRRRVAVELISDLERVHQRKKAADKEVRELLKTTGRTLTDLNGIGPSGAARLPVEVGDITRSLTGRISRPGTAPLRSTHPQATRCATGYRAPGTGRSTGRCTSWPSSSSPTATVPAGLLRSQGRRGKTPMEAMRIRFCPQAG
jgi:hypothetical protein